MTNILAQDSDLFEAIMHKIEDQYGYIANDWSKVQICLYEGRDDCLVNCYEVVKPLDGAHPIFDEYRIRSFRAYLTGDDDQLPDDQVYKVELT